MGALMVRHLAVVVLGLVLGVFAVQPVRADAAVKALADAMDRNPERVLTMAEDVIAGYGGPGGLTPQDIADYIALERAAARAAAMRKLLAADLDNDGTLQRQELAVGLRAASADQRGRMERQFKSADIDGNDSLDAAEIRAEGQVAALKALSETEAEVLAALISLDADGDGALRAPEVQAAVRRPKDDG